ncbi:MAG: UDP-N-acetylmuramoyl-L-alanine--D-glutamate ligase [Myxococcales bacterium FL481]|nr:MAG: UDP-N-acetylmuramoyl-L-alanine--D-glutamate ligase [Myxococcales bacterium FL481]
MGRAKGDRALLDRQLRTCVGRPGHAQDPMNGAGPWRRALVLGLGASGRAAAALLIELGCEVRGYDRAPQLASPLPGVETWLGESEAPPKAFAGVDLVVLSPGLPPTRPLEQCAEHCPGAEIHGELSLGLAALERLGTWPRTCLVTGTNGKSTVTSMIGHLLQGRSEPLFVGGNLGPTLCDHVRGVVTGGKVMPAQLVLECSSYQLETLRPVATDVAMVLNVSPDHLDRYATMQAYAATKGRVFAGLREDGLALLDAEDRWTGTLAGALEGRAATLVGGDQPPRLAANDELDLGKGRVFPRSRLALAGRHNAKNALFALAAASHQGVPWHEAVERLATFVGLPHRMALVASLDGVTYYNDSKATNVASVIASLGGFDRRFVLIAGGRAKGEDLSPLRDLLREQGAGLVAIGESAASFLSIADGVVPTRYAVDMPDAVRQAQLLAQPGEAIVLSPACASWDMYANYGERGQAFAAAVLG